MARCLPWETRYHASRFVSALFCRHWPWLMAPNYRTISMSGWLLRWMMLCYIETCQYITSWNMPWISFCVGVFWQMEIEKCKNIVVENEMGHTDITQILSQHDFNPTALCSCDPYIACLPVSTNLILLNLFMFEQQLTGNQICNQWFKPECLRILWKCSTICSSAGFNMLCSNAVHFLPQSGDFSASSKKRVIFGIALFSALHDIEHSFV